MITYQNDKRWTLPPQSEGEVFPFATLFCVFSLLRPYRQGVLSRRSVKSHPHALHKALHRVVSHSLELLLQGFLDVFRIGEGA